MKKIRTIQAVVLEEKKLKVCAYVRVSTDQTEQKNGFSAQMEHYTAYTRRYPGLSYVCFGPKICKYPSSWWDLFELSFTLIQIGGWVLPNREKSRRLVNNRTHLRTNYTS